MRTNCVTIVKTLLTTHGRLGQNIAPSGSSITGVRTLGSERIWSDPSFWKVVTMEGSHGSCGGNRRRFLQTAAAAGPVLAAAGPALAATAGVPTITLGKTGQEVTRLGMGSGRS